MATSAFAKNSLKSLTFRNKCAFRANQAASIIVIPTGPNVDSVSAITVPETQSEWIQATLTVAAEMELSGCLMVRISVLLVRPQLRMNTLNFATRTIVATFSSE